MQPKFHSKKKPYKQTNATKQKKQKMAVPTKLKKKRRPTQCKQNGKQNGRLGCQGLLPVWFPYVYHIVLFKKSIIQLGLEVFYWESLMQSAQMLR